MKVSAPSFKGYQRGIYRRRRVEQIVEQSTIGDAQARNALKGIRIPVFGLKGRRPSPLDDEGTNVMSI
jgi:hypothetical protein